MDVRIKTDVSAELLTYAEVAGFIKYDDDDAAEISLITEMITMVRSHFEKITGKSFIEKTYQCHFKSTERPFILPYPPVISIVSAKSIDYEGTEEELTLNSEYWKRGKYEIEIITSGGGVIDNPFRELDSRLDIEVEYKAGYGHSDTESLPYDLRMAMLMQIKQWYDNRDDFMEFNILGSIARVLRKHKSQLF